MMRRTSILLVLMVAGRLLAFADDGVSLDQPLTGKFLHVLGGMAAGLAAAGIVDIFIDPSSTAQAPWLLPAAALAGAALAGISKEVLDSTGFGDPQFTDILITSSGGMAVALMLGYAQTLYPSTRSGQVNSASYIFSLAALLALPVINGFLVEIRRYEARQVQPSSR
jgi:hypothetical protein